MPFPLAQTKGNLITDTVNFPNLLKIERSFCPDCL